MSSKGLFPNLKEFRSDLEIAPMESVLPVFIPESISTCFFHLAQAHWRKVQSLGLVELYSTNGYYNMLLRCFTALAFVPKDRIPEYYEILCQSLPNDCPAEVHAFVDYIAETYVGQKIYERVSADKDETLVLRINLEYQWKDPKFPPKLWSVYERVLTDEPRTTNKLEGWHRRFSMIVAKHHPNIYDFIGCLRSEQSKIETQITKLLMGNLPKQKKESVDKNKRIKTIVEKFSERDAMDYLKGLAFNVKY